MPNTPKRHMVAIDGPLYVALGQIAREEERTVTVVARRILREALVARGLIKDDNPRALKSVKETGT